VPLGGGSAPIGLIAGVSAVLIALLALLAVRRHRRLGADTPDRPADEPAEAW
jgi:ABC-type Fe3+ transport system permease subunit